MILPRSLQLAKDFLSQRLAGADTVIDATAGNGHDTLFLAQSTPDTAHVWAFDIQEQALVNTAALLDKHGLLSKVRLVGVSHTEIDGHVDRPVDVAMFNLGYLPGASHAVTTLADSTVEALSRLLPLLKCGGLVAVVAYPGYAAGMIENNAVREFFALLPQENFTVGCWQLLNQRNNPPILYIVEKIRSDGREGVASRKD